MSLTRAKRARGPGIGAPIGVAKVTHNLADPFEAELAIGVGGADPFMVDGGRGAQYATRCSVLRSTERASSREDRAADPRRPRSSAE